MYKNHLFFAFLFITLYYFRLMCLKKGSSSWPKKFSMTGILFAKKKHKIYTHLSAIYAIYTIFYLFPIHTLYSSRFENHFL